jgi:hypothetical protein
MSIPSVDLGLRKEPHPPRCRFLRLAITVDTTGVAREVRGPVEAGSIIESLFGAAEEERLSVDLDALRFAVFDLAELRHQIEQARRPSP